MLLPKKNGKTTLLAALALYHLLRTEEADCVIAAASRDHAGIMFKQAGGFVRRSPALEEELSVKTVFREIATFGTRGASECSPTTWIRRTA